jgi:hypothetical protein
VQLVEAPGPSDAGEQARDASVSGATRERAVDRVVPFKEAVTFAV